VPIEPLAVDEEGRCAMDSRLLGTGDVIENARTIGAIAENTSWS
jgi:hypothetical protein